MTGFANFEEIEAARAGIPRTLMVIGDSKSASWAYRVEWPCTGLRDHGYVGDWVMTNEASGSVAALEAGRYNLVVAPRLHWANRQAGQDWSDSVRGYGCGWAYEVDDDAWSPEIVQRQARLFESEWFKGEYQLEEERQERLAIINQADGVIVTTEALASVARSFTSRPVHVVPNLLNTNWFLGRLSDTKRIIPPLTVGWSGGVRDEADLEIVAQAWTRVAARYPDVHFVIHGITPRVLATSVPSSQLILMAWTALPDYPRSMINIDIACCAVQAGPNFNSAKSPIKWFECSMAGAACAVSPVVYGTVVTHGVDALVCSTVEEWDEALSRLIEDEDYRRDMNEHAKQQVWSEHSLTRKWHVWVETLAAILADGKRIL
jgi:hypothetical protein